MAAATVGSFSMFTDFSIDSILHPAFGRRKRKYAETFGSRSVMPMVKIETAEHEHYSSEVLRHRYSTPSPFSDAHRPWTSHESTTPRSPVAVHVQTPAEKRQRYSSHCESPDFISRTYAPVSRLDAVPSATSSISHHQPTRRCSESSESRSDSAPSSPDSNTKSPPGDLPWPAWVYCTRYSDRPSAGPRSRKSQKPQSSVNSSDSKSSSNDAKRPRTAFSNDQINRLKVEFDQNAYLTEERRLSLAEELKLTESQIKIWFQNKRAKTKKASGVQNILAVHLAAQGLYKHTNGSSNSGSESD